MALSYRIWNSSADIPSHPLALFIVMFPEAHLTSLSRKSGSRWMTTLLWLSGLWWSVLYSSSVYSCHLFFFKKKKKKTLYLSTPVSSYLIDTGWWEAGIHRPTYAGGFRVQSITLARVTVPLNLLFLLGPCCFCRLITNTSFWHMILYVRLLYTV